MNTVYGLPTRLLDITSNPFVALFSACQGNHDVDGAIYLFSAPTFWQNNWAIKIKTNYIFEPEDWIDDLISRECANLPSEGYRITICRFRKRRK